MARGTDIAWAAAAGVGIVLVSSALRPSPRRAPAKKKKASAWKGGAPRRIRALAGRLEDQLGWHGFGDFLVAKAWTESRGNPKAGSSARSNEARGWFGLRPKSALVRDYAYLVRQNPNILKNERWAVAMAAWYAKRLRPYAFSGQLIDWLALARGWALPRLVSDVNHTAKVKGYAPGERSDDVLRRFEQAVLKSGRDPDVFMYERAFPPGWSWPGIDVVLEILDAPAPGSVAGRRHAGRMAA